VKTASEERAKFQDIVTYTLTFSNSAAYAVTGVVVTDNLPTTAAVSYVNGSASNSGSYDKTSNVLTWNFQSVAAGESVTLTYDLDVLLLAGAYSPLVNTAQLSYTGRSTTATHSLPVGGSYVIHIAVYNSVGEEMKELKEFQLSIPLSKIDLTGEVITTDDGAVNVYYKGTLIGSWDATTASGKKVTNGAYLLKITSTDPYGVSSSVTKDVKVQIARNILEVTVYNESGEAVKKFSPEDLEGLISGSFLPSDYDVGKSKSGPSVITPSYSNPMLYGNYATITLGSGRSFDWTGRGDNGKILSNGHYFIQVKASMIDGGQQEILMGILIQDADTNAISGVVMAPNPVNFSQTNQARFLVGSNMGPVDGFKVKIYTLSGELKETLLNDPGNPTQATWSPTRWQIASGTYIAAVELYSNGGVVGRRVLKAFVLH
jgi:uncharacterized repeat protein (TIGR01451 family)